MSPVPGRLRRARRVPAARRTTMANRKGSKKARPNETWTFQPEPDVAMVIGALVRSSHRRRCKSRFLNLGLRSGLVGDRESVLEHIDERIKDLQTLRKAVLRVYRRVWALRAVRLQPVEPARSSAASRKR